MSEQRFKRFDEIEERGRLLASDLKALKPSTADDHQWFTDVENAAYEMQDILEENEKPHTRVLANRTGDLAYHGVYAVNKCRTTFKTEAKTDCPIINDTLRQAIHNTDYAMEGALNSGEGKDVWSENQRKCAWGLDALEEKGQDSKYSLASLINDTDMCFHRALEVAKKAALSWHKEGKCQWRE